MPVSLTVSPFKAGIATQFLIGCAPDSWNSEFGRQYIVLSFRLALGYEEHGVNCQAMSDGINKPCELARYRLYQESIVREMVQS